MNTQQLVKSYLYGNLLFLGIFVIYTEASVKKIIFRPNDQNQLTFNPRGLWSLITYPFTSLDSWKIRNWDLNFIVFTQIGALVYTFLKLYPVDK